MMQTLPFPNLRRQAFIFITLIGLLLLSHLPIAAQAPACPPTLSFTTIPPYGSSDSLTGQADCIVPADYKVAIYIYVGGWWNKPTFAAPLTDIQADGSWTATIVTHPNDVNASQIAAFLLPVGYAPPLISGDPFLPQAVGDNSVATAYTARTAPGSLSFSGYTWNIKTSASLVGPGPNYFSDNVWVDTNGRLHLNIHQQDNTWHSTEIVHTAPFPLGYGRYSFALASPVAQLDPNVVLGLFTWDSSAPEHAYREIDIEVARWGNANDPTNAQYVVQPYTNSGNLRRFTTGSSATSLHRFTWCPGKALFDSYSGLIPTPNNLIDAWQNSGSDVPPADTDREVSPHLNLWLMNGSAPSDGQPVEIIIDHFAYEPLVEQLPPAADVAIQLNNGVTLSWTAVSGAASYELWHDSSNFYFTPPATACAQAANCTITTDPAANPASTDQASYLVRPVNQCGTAATQLSNRVGSFSFNLIPGTDS